MNKSLLRFANAAGVLLVVGSAIADDSIRIGGARAAGMGGAGIALPVEVAQNQRLNPAFLAFGKKKIALQYPEIGLRTYGLKFGDLKDVLGNVNDAGLSNDSVLTLARQFGDHRTEAAADAGFGLVLANISVSFSGGADITAIPNASLSGYIASNPPDLSGLPADSRLDAYGYGFYQTAVGMGEGFTTKAGGLMVGGRVKAVKAYYAHKVADQTAIQSGNGVRNGSEFGVGSGDTMSKSSLGADLGVLYSPKVLKNIYFGGTIDNLIKPGVGFTRTLPNSDVATETFNPFATVTTVGAGAMFGKNVLLAADIYDVFSDGIGRELRLGGELQVSHLAAVRGGYNSRSGFTLGASVMGFNFSIAGREPLVVSTTIRF